MTAKLSRRDFLRNTAGATAAATLAPVAGAVSASAPQQDDIALTFWMFADNRVTWMESFFEEIWGPENPNITVEIEHVPYADLWPKVQAVFVAGAGAPDMVDVAVGELGQFLRGGDENFLRIDDYLGDEINDLSIPSATKNWTIRGNVYGVGNEVNPLLLYYRSDLFEELGLDPDGITTWQEYTSTYGAVAKENGRALHYIAVDDATDFQLFYYQAGGQFFDDNENVTILDNDLAVEVLTWMKENYDAGVFIDRGTWDGQYAIMNNSDVIATKGAPWFQGFMKTNLPDLSGKWKMRQMPLWQEGGFLSAPWGGTGMCITAGSPNPDACWSFIHRANLTEDGSLLAFREMNLFPSYIPAWDAEELYRTDDYFSGQEPATFIAEAAAGMAGITYDPYWALFTDALSRIAYTPVFLEDADPATVLAEAVDEFEFSK